MKIGHHYKSYSGFLAAAVVHFLAALETQVLQLRDAGVPRDLIYRDVGISGAIGTNSRKAWRALNSRVGPGDVLVVAAVDRIGRRWMDTASGTCTVARLGSVPCAFGTALDALLRRRPGLARGGDRRRTGELLYLGGAAGTREHPQQDQGGSGQGQEQRQDLGNAS